MTDVPIFPFSALHPHLHLLVLNQMDTDTLIKFRKSCKFAYELTNLRVNSIKIPESRYLTVVYKSDGKKFQCRAEKDMLTLVNAPLHKFWSRVRRMELELDSVFKVDQDLFLEGLENFQYTFESLKVKDVRPLFLDFLLQKLVEVQKLTLFSTRFYSDKYLMTNNLQNFKGAITVLDPEDRKRIGRGRRRRYVEPESLAVPIEGINHMFKCWSMGEYKFSQFNLEPLQRDMDLEPFWRDVYTKVIFDRESHHRTPLRELEHEKFGAKIDFLRTVVAVKKATGNSSLLVFVYHKRLHSVVIPNNNIIRHTVQTICCNKFRRNVCPDLLNRVYSQTVF